jgi:nucleoside-specific outer membrane channel protein Tsx
LTNPTSRRATLLATLALALAPAAARAQFATTNLQLLDGWAFHDPSVGSDANDGKMATITLNHFSTWKYGDNFAFVDFTQAPKEFTDGTKSHLYGEIHPRLFLNRLAGTQGTFLGILRDGGIATEVNYGQGFQAYLAGLGADFALPFPGTIALNVYYRYAELQVGSFRDYNHTWQVSPWWVIPFQAGVPWLFTGFVDINGVKAGKGWKGHEVMTQPELLVDVLAIAGGPKNVFYAGIEWYLHYSPNNVALGAPKNTISAPQAMIQVNLH